MLAGVARALVEEADSLPAPTLLEKDSWEEEQGAPYIGTPIAMGKNRRDSERCVRLPLLVSLQLMIGGALTNCAHARSALIVQQERIKHWYWYWYCWCWRGQASTGQERV